MADTLIGSGFDQSVGTRQLAGQTQTEFYNKQSGQGFSDPNQLSSFVNQNFQGVQSTGQNVFDVLKTQYTPVKASPSPVVDSSALAQPPKTILDVQSLLNQNQQNQQQFLSAMQPSQQEQTLMQQLNQANDSLKNFNVSLEGGIQKIMDKPIALEFQQGQQSSLTRDAAFTRSSLARGVDSIATQLSTAQQLRDMTLQRLQAQQQFGKDDLQTALQMQQVQKQEQSAAKEFALKFGVTSQFYNIGGTIYRSGDGKVYSDPQSFFADAGVGSFDEATKKNLIQIIDGNQIKQKEQEQALVADLATKYADAGITLADTLATAQAKLKGSRIYAQATRLASGTGSGSGSGGGGNPTIDSWVNLIQSGQASIANVPANIKNAVANQLGETSNIDEQVKQIIANNPGEWGQAADQIEKLLGGKIATGSKYDEWLKAHYQQGKSVDTLATTNKNIKATDSNNQAAGYALRVQQSGGILKNLEPKIASYDPIGFATQMKLPSYLKSSQIQSYDQAARNFINSVLRRESGAVISPSEFESAYQQYLPKPGDSQSTLEQKRQNRDSVYKGLVNSAGPAWESLNGSSSNNNDPLGIR